jgi:UDP-3-O-[3-hydroxymyristoyl] glucosamine N-acyltransferase
MAGVDFVEPVLLSALVARHGGRIDASIGGRRVERLTTPADAVGETDLVVLTSARWAAAAAAAPGVVLCSEELAPRVSGARCWTHEHAQWVLAAILEDHALLAPLGPLRADTAVVEPGADVSATARVSSGAVVMAGAVVGDGCSIGPGAVIHGGARLERDVIVGANSVVGRPGFGWAVGPLGAVRRIPQLGGVVVEAEAEIGALCTIDAGTLGPTRIGRGVKLDAHVHVGHNVVIEPGVLVAAQAGFAGSVRIGAGVRIGGQAGIADHVTVGAGARIAAKSGVIGDIPPGAVVAGFPAVPRVRWLRALAAWMGPKSRGTRR